MENNIKNDALDEASKMMRIPMNELPELATEFLKLISKNYGFCVETCLTAYAIYCQVVLKMKCDDDLYHIKNLSFSEKNWWIDKGFEL